MSDAVIKASHITKDLVSDFLRKRVRVLDGLNLTVRRGETYGLLGPNGAGKTTALKIMLGLMRPTDGSMTVLGVPAGDNRAKMRLGYLPENPYFYSHLTGREFLTLSDSFFACLFI